MCLRESFRVFFSRGEKKEEQRSHPHSLFLSLFESLPLYQQVNLQPALIYIGIFLVLWMCPWACFARVGFASERTQERNQNVHPLFSFSFHSFYPHKKQKKQLPWVPTRSHKVRLFYSRGHFCCGAAEKLEETQTVRGET